MEEEKIDPKYLSQDMRDKLQLAILDLQENPITKLEEIKLWFRVNVYLYGKVLFLRFCLFVKKVLFL
jgi:hypothetical protein